MSTRRSAASEIGCSADDDVRRDATASRAFAADVQYYLALHPRQLPSRYLYDDARSALFDAICQLPWYGSPAPSSGCWRRTPPRSSRTLGRSSTLVELGPGSGEKLRDAARRRRARHRAARRASRSTSRRGALDVARADASDRSTACTSSTHEAPYEAGLAQRRRATRGRDGRDAGAVPRIEHRQFRSAGGRRVSARHPGGAARRATRC